MRESEIIARFFAPLSQAEPGSFLLSDDAAILTPPTGFQLVVTTDSVIQNVHVLADATPAQYAQKLVRRNLSDLAAMGATPWRYLLNLRVPRTTDAAWLQTFSDTLQAEQTLFGMVLAGGDTTLGDGPIHLTLTALGLTDQPPLLRSGAKPGDDLYVSGTIGDAALGLHHADAFLKHRYHIPQPRLALGQALRGIATAALDCSDGLIKDTARLCAASSVSAVIERGLVPLSPAAQAQHELPNFWETILTGGDDYELIFTAPVNARALLNAQEVTRIGTVQEGNDVTVMHAGHDVTPTRTGYEY